MSIGFKCHHNTMLADTLAQGAGEESELSVFVTSVSADEPTLYHAVRWSNGGIMLARSMQNVSDVRLSILEESCHA